LIVIARNDDVTFGILSSRIHVCWALALGSTLEDRPAYATTTCFETFPFPDGMAPNGYTANNSNPHSQEIAAASRALTHLRDQWLAPAEWSIKTAEVDEHYPLRIEAKPGHEVDLRRRTLTALYNAAPQWLQETHRKLDSAVAAAYGWSDFDDSTPDEILLARLLELNHSRDPISVAHNGKLP
jgi:hypothetical protein